MMWTQKNLLLPAKHDAGTPPTRSRIEERAIKLEDEKPEFGVGGCAC